MRGRPPLVLTGNAPRPHPTPVQRLLRASDYVVPFTVRALARAGVLDALDAGLEPAQRTAADLGLGPPAVTRALELLAAHGLLDRTAAGFGVTAGAGLPLAREHDPLVAALLGRAAHWGRFADTLRDSPGCVPPDLDDHVATLRLLVRFYGERAGGFPTPLDWVTPVVLRAITEAGVPDHLADTPATVTDLARRAGLRAYPLLLCLRLLALRGVVRDEGVAGYAHTRVSLLLRRGHPARLARAHPLLAAVVAAWAGLDGSLRTGEPAFDAVHGISLWGFLSEHPEAHHAFSAAMGAVSGLEMRTLATYPWSGLRTLVDVGGGDASTIAAILGRTPDLRAVTVDLPYLRAAAVAELERCGLAARGAVVAGDFFVHLPEGADAYLLKRVLYGWPDEAALRILRTVRRSMRKDSRVLVAEPMFGLSGADEAVLRSIDILMLAVDGGRIRNAGEITALLRAAGLTLTRTIRTPLFPLLEATAS
jgi:peptidoglycan/xylan/chitin deacetylase (PgdA/CDA1 family)